MSIILSPLAYFTTYNVLVYRPLRWNTTGDLAKALIRGNVLSALLSELCYAWHMAGLPDFDMTLPAIPLCTPHFYFAYYFQARAHLCRVLRPWNMRDIYKDTLKPVRSILPKMFTKRCRIRLISIQIIEDLVQRNRLIKRSSAYNACRKDSTC
ncbi:hypothetical protein BJV77DRAFT_90997 [Russula vinacea]|nr:hypothetical protein BJV77DRAFT_90997 [Russula vinacea]